MVTELPFESEKEAFVELTNALNLTYEKLKARCTFTLTGKVRVLDLSELGLSKLKFHFSMFKSLVIVKLDRNELIELPDFEKVKSLKELSVIENQISTLATLSTIPTLETLNINNNPLRSFDLPEMPNLTKLKASNCMIDDFSGLINCLSLKELYISYNNITELNKMPKMSKLRVLDLRYNKLTSFDSFPELPALWFLIMSNNQLSSLNGINKFSRLQKLEINDNKIQSFAELKELDNLITVIVSNNPLCNQYPELCQGHKNSLIDIQKLLGVYDSKKHLYRSKEVMP